MLGANMAKKYVGLLGDSHDIDHYENTCILGGFVCVCAMQCVSTIIFVPATDFERCGNRHLAFLLVRNAELIGFSVGLGSLPVGMCLTRCLDSPSAFCRSVQIRAGSDECFLSTERPLAPLPSDEMDIYEPICLPDPPQTSTLECLGEHVFERVPNMDLRLEEEEEEAAEQKSADHPKAGGTGLN